MNRLQLAQRLHADCGVSGNAPATTLNQTGELGRLVNWIDSAWNEIQLFRPNWDWMLDSVSFQTVAGQYEYTPTQAGVASTLADWKLDSFRNYLTSAGIGSEQYMNEMTYGRFRDYYLFSTRVTSLAQPLDVAVRPQNKNLLLGSPPDQVYTVVGEYYKLPTVLTADADTPNMPERYHMAIVYRAMIDYGQYEAAPEVLARGNERFKQMMLRLDHDQLQPMELGGPLA